MEAGLDESNKLIRALAMATSERDAEAIVLVGTGEVP